MTLKFNQSLVAGFLLCWRPEVKVSAKTAGISVNLKGKSAKTAGISVNILEKSAKNAWISVNLIEKSAKRNTHFKIS